MSKNSSNRRGAALMVALVLIAFIGVVASTTLARILRDRQEVRMDLVRQQARRLLDDAIRSAETQRTSDSEFSGETLVLGADRQPVVGTFQVITKYQGGRFNAEVKYWGVGKSCEKSPCLSLLSQPRG